MRIVINEIIQIIIINQTILCLNKIITYVYVFCNKVVCSSILIITLEKNNYINKCFEPLFCCARRTSPLAALVLCFAFGKASARANNPCKKLFFAFHNYITKATDCSVACLLFQNYISFWGF